MEQPDQQQLMQDFATQSQQQEQNKQQANLPVTLSLTLGEANVILRALDAGAGPSTNVSTLVPIINKITVQAQEQIRAMQTQQQPQFNQIQMTPPTSPLS